MGGDFGLTSGPIGREGRGGTSLHNKEGAGGRADHHVGEHHWPEAHPACGGGAQSPIAIRTSGVQPDPSLPPIRPEGYESPGAELLALSNNGHTAVLELPRSLRLRGLPRSFTAEQLHFHWGGAGRSGGAEHILDGHRAAAEMHVVHYDAERYGNASDAQHHSGGLAVLGHGPDADGVGGTPPNRPPLTCPPHPPPPGQRTSIPPFSIRDLLPSRLDLYYRYNGSLTTPPCFQSVLWTLFQEPVRISQAQVRGKPPWNGGDQTPPPIFHVFPPHIPCVPPPYSMCVPPPYSMCPPPYSMCPPHIPCVPPYSMSIPAGAAPGNTL
uniref:Uncharacterized protein n=1 Tax=Melopsittacus undulatus TaxID=13146 RepID=A0A8V5GPA5_MELUD